MRDSGAAQRNEGDDRNGKTLHDISSMMFVRMLARLAAFVAMLFAAVPAYAHSGTGLAGGFVAGVAHPVTGPDHMLAMIAVGLWGHFLQRPLIFLLPMIFPIMMAVGAGIGMFGVGLPPVELGIAASVIVLGALILGAVRLHWIAACAIVAVFALFHGYAHGVELPSAADPIGYSLGFVVATGMLHVFGIAVGALGASRRGAMMVRGAGLGVLGMGAYFLWAVRA
jgi:urease accessory protein